MSIIELAGQGDDGRTRICEMYSKYPVRLMQHSHWIRSYVAIVGLGFGGGLVQGDSTSLNLLLRDRAEGWLTRIVYFDIFDRNNIIASYLKASEHKDQLKYSNVHTIKFALK